MEKLAQAFFSMRMMALGMFMFLVAIGGATLLESSYDIQTAKIVVYNALWFELLLVYLTLNLVANIFRYNMFQREKIAMLSFHLSFIVIIAGAAVTRYISFEGMMIIREGEASNTVHSSDPHISIRVHDGKMQFVYNKKLFLSELNIPFICSNDFSIPVSFPNHNSPIQIEYVDFKKKLVDSMIVNDSLNSFVLEIITDGMKSNYLNKNDFIQAGNVAVTFEGKNPPPGIQLREERGKILMKADEPVRYLPMAEMQKARQTGQVADSLFTEIPANKEVPFQTTTLYKVGEQQIVFKQLIRHARRMLVPSGKKNVGQDYLTIRVSDGAKQKLVTLKGGIGAVPNPEIFELNGLTYELAYGSMEIKLPFSVRCNDFQLEKYPGSESPSSFASEVTVLDKANKKEHRQRIFMNHVMDYQGYRFFQSSYDLDVPSTPENEEGTRLSVNADWWGTNITYLGYLLMAIGMVLSLFAPKGRLRELNEMLRKSRVKREKLAGVIVMLLALPFSFSVSAQNHQHADPSKKAPFGVMSTEHSEEASSLLVQDFQGRIVPMHTLCLNLLRKIHRADKFEKYNAVQTIVSMHMYPQYWFDKKIVYVSSNLREKLGVKGTYASVEDLLNKKNEFKLSKEHAIAFQKPESKRNEFDKNLIKLVDRYEVIHSFPGWNYMRLVPLKNAPNNTWYVPIDERVYKTDSLAFFTALGYFRDLFEAANSNDYTKANASLKKFKTMQRLVGAKVVPSETAVNMEIRYNKMNIFKQSWRSYLILGFVLLCIYFVRIFAKPSENGKTFMTWTNRVFTGLVILIFAYHGSGLGIRWYISGHAPWSNGYEAVVFIAWATVIAGFIFAQKNPVVLAGTAILASMMIFVTELNLLDPEVTNLQPVLKSYWLMIHVAIITSSYGFLGLAAILGLLNLLLYIFRNRGNGKVVTLNINELTHISEMTMTIGLFMLTIGTFLGGVWANESWGRYWGWDPKETWALVSVLVYAVILHLRYIPALNGKFTFNVVSFWGYSAILFTFFGVNFYLVGLHSYAQGEGLGQFPDWILYTALAFLGLTVVAGIKNKQYAKLVKEEALNTKND
jgi:cytochrome c-type biogenesis protein CcsB